MSTEPRDPGLAALFRATVRVAKGSGVVIRNCKAALIVTAAHVVKEGETHTVGRGTSWGECTVIARNNDSDLAVLTAPVALEAASVAFADEAANPQPGDPIWAAGYPDGWGGHEPLIAPGTVAGLGKENWVNLDGTWGNSGGAICRIAEGAPVVVGTLLAKAGEANRDLQDLRRTVQTFQAELRAELQAERTKMTERPGSLFLPEGAKFLDNAKTASLQATSSSAFLVCWMITSGRASSGSLLWPNSGSSSAARARSCFEGGGGEIFWVQDRNRWREEHEGWPMWLRSGGPWG